MTWQQWRQLIPAMFIITMWRNMLCTMTSQASRLHLTVPEPDVKMRSLLVCPSMSAFHVNPLCAGVAGFFGTSAAAGTNVGAATASGKHAARR